MSDTDDDVFDFLYLLLVLGTRVLYVPQCTGAPRPACAASLTLVTNDSLQNIFNDQCIYIPLLSSNTFSARPSAPCARRHSTIINY